MSEIARTCCKTTLAQAHADGCTSVATDPVDYQGQDSEVEYLLEVYPDGAHVLKTRPIGGARWSRPVTLGQADG